MHCKGRTCDPRWGSESLPWDLGASSGWMDLLCVKFGSVSCHRLSRRLQRRLDCSEQKNNADMPKREKDREMEIDR